MAIELISDEYHTALDADYLKDLYQDDWSYAYEMFCVFEAEVLPEYANLRQLCDTKQWDVLAREAHKLSPPLAMVGLTSLQQCLRSIEMAIVQGESCDDLPQKLTYFDEQLSRMSIIIRQETERLAHKTVLP